jgi:hypothetical protein
MGAVVLVLVVVAAAFVHVASGRMAAAGPAAFRAPAAAGLAAALAATVLAGTQLFRPGFSPSHAGGLGSVFIGFIAFYFLHLIGGVYWLETQIVQRPSDILRGSVPPCLLYWWYLAVVLAIFSVLFYLVGERDPSDREGRMGLISMAINDSSAGGYLTLVIPVGFLLIVLACGWAMRHRVP